MKLAEALNVRFDIQKRIAQLRERMAASAKVQEGDSPAEDSNALLREAELLVEQLTSLIKRINRTNLNVTITGGSTMTEALADRDGLLLRIAYYRALAEAAAAPTQRYRPTELRSISQVNVKDLRSTLDNLSKELRSLDTQIQSTNWSTDLLD